jgi:hypothetical protein
VQALLTWVRTGSVSERSRTGVGGHQRSPVMQRNRRSPPVQLKHLGGCRRAIRIVVPKVGGSSPLGHPHHQRRSPRRWRDG